jgi:sulfotransferase
MRALHIIAGLPRAGSTLLCQVLNSNPRFHVTPTSGVLDMLKTMRGNFSTNMTFRAQNRLSIYENFRNGLKGFLDGYFYDNEVVFDKNRAWTSNLNILDSIVQNNNTKVIWLYRDPVEIVSSIEAQYQKTILLENMDESAAPGAFMTLERRISTYTSPEGLIGFPIESLKDAIEMGFANRILFVKYYDLTNDPKKTLEMIHDFIEEEYYEYDFKNVKQSTWEFDGVYNYKFPHTIKEGEIKYKRADLQLEPKYVAAINDRYVGLNKLIFEGDPSVLLGLNPEEFAKQIEEMKKQQENNQSQQPGLFEKMIMDNENI